MKRAVDEDFPRGGGDFPRGDGDSSAPRARPLKKRAVALPRLDDAPEDGRLGGGVTSRLGTFVEQLKYKGLSVGMKLWGVVTEVNKRQLSVSLPSGLRGVVRYTEVSDVHAELDGRRRAAAEAEESEEEGEGEEERVGEGPSLAPLTALFQPGQRVRCCVSKLTALGSAQEGSRLLELSLRLSALAGGQQLQAVRPGRLLPAVVRSVEDHGYVLSFGPQALSGFLPRSAAPSDAQLHPGQLLEAVVTAQDARRRVLTVRCEPAAVRGAGPLVEADDCTLAGLSPGDLLACRVRAVLADGLVLTFLTYFSGTVDWFQLDKPPFPQPGQLGGSYAVGDRLRARILFVDAATKRVGLTLRTEHLELGAMAQLPPLGAKLAGCTVARVDAAVGLLLALPGTGGAQAGYCHVSNASDARVERLEKAFKRGATVDARVVGHRAMDGLAALSLKASVFGAAFFSVGDVSPGVLAEATVESCDAVRGCLLSLGPGLRASCSVSHLSDAGGAAAAKKLRPGARVRCRVLAVDAAARRVRVTLKPTLLAAKHPPLCSAADAQPGRVAQGWVTGVQPYGAFVSFYGALRGLVHARNLGLQPGQAPQEALRLGEVVTVTVLGASRSERRGEVLELALGKRGAAEAASAGAALPPRALLAPLQLLPCATVTRVEGGGGGGARRGVEVSLGGGWGDAFLEEAHLADQPACAAALLALLAPGATLGPLLVLCGGARPQLTLKPALLAACAQGALPAALPAVAVGQLLCGYVASTSSAGVFVRFADRLTGLAPLSQLADGFAPNAPSLWALGRTVHARVTAVDAQAGRLSLSLKSSACTPPHGAHALASLLASARQRDALQALAQGESLAWAAAYPVGRAVEATLAQMKPPFGAVLDLDGDDDAVGLALTAHLQAVGMPGVGARVRGVVLDVNRAEGIVDVGLRPELLAPSDKAAKTKSKKKSAAAPALALGAVVEAEVELVKGEYLVASLPAHARRIAFVQTRALGEPPAVGAAALDARFSVGQQLRCRVAEVGGEGGADGAPLLTLEAEEGGARTTAPSGPRTATVVSVLPLELQAQLPGGRYGRIHVTQLAPPAPAKASKKAEKAEKALLSPLAAFSCGQALRVTVRGQVAGSSAPDGKPLLSLSLGEGEAGADAEEGHRPPTLDALSPGCAVVGYLESCGEECAWLALAPSLRGRLAALDALTPADAAHPQQAQPLGSRFAPGQPLRCFVLACDSERRHVDLGLAAPPADAGGPPALGAPLPGRVAKVVPGVGLYVQLPQHRSGRVALTDLSDSYEAAPLERFRTGQLLRCVVVGAGSASAGGHIDLSLRASRGGDGGCAQGGAQGGAAQAEVCSVGDCAAGSVVWGYVKSCSQKGLFVSLGRGVDARVLLSNLSDAFVKAPGEVFPQGTRVQGRVLSADPKSGRLELSLKASDVSAQQLLKLQDLTVGQLVRGVVKRVEPYGVFVSLDGSALVGMCHISMFSDERVKSLPQRVAPGKRVRAKVMAADVDAGRLSLGMKASLFEGEEEEEEEEDLQQADPLAAGDDAAMEDAPLEEEEAMEVEGIQPKKQKKEKKVKGKRAQAAAAAAACDDWEGEGEDEDEELPVRQAPASSALLAQLMGSEDELAFAWAEGDGGGGTAHAEEAEPMDPVASAAAAKKARKRDKRAAEEALRVRERALASGDAVPSCAADFERAILASPSSSYLWIAFMAHLASLGEPAAARAVAERALSGGSGAIGYREQRELLNVWVAYLNLEAAFGDEPREKGVAALFARAVQRCDPKALHLALVGIHERAGQTEAASAAAGALCRKFRGSCKAWLRAVTLHLQGGSGEAAKGALDRAVAALPQRKHAKLLVSCALQEFRLGEPERGRALLEGVLQAAPRRLDVWNVYLDAEAKHGEPARARALFQRAVHSGLPAKKAKPLFKRYLAYERLHGDDASVLRVKQLAAAYVAEVAARAG